MAIKVIKSETFNEIFDTESGFSAQWGRTKDENPAMNPFGPSLLDIEISERCEGPFGTPCSFCYKSNTTEGSNMSLETLEHILKIIPKTVHQIAYGIGTISLYPELWDAFALTRKYDIVPNVTINGAEMSDENVANLVKYCGSMAVSHYGDDICFDAVKKLTDANSRKQVNIHKIISENTFQSCLDLIESASTDPRLKKLNAIVFLQVKPKGKHNTLVPLRSIEKYKRLVRLSEEKGVGIGFDSCSAPMALQSLDKSFHAMVEPCESTLMSGYISCANNKAEFFPCSFTEGTTSSGDWTTGIDLLQVNDFVKEVWYNPRVVAWRGKNQKSSASCDCPNSSLCRSCVVYDISPCNPKPELDNSLVQLR